MAAVPGRCEGCAGGLEETTATWSVELPRSGVVASVTAPAGRCAACGAVRMAPDVEARAALAAGRALADAAVHTGEALRHMRKALGLRASDLARLLGVTPETVSHWETGKALPARAAFAAVAAMVEDALEGCARTRDRLEALAAGVPHPRAVAVSLPRASRDGG